jgi:GNAT superfamily N-acetyltransferase
VRATVEDAQLCFGIARAASVVGFRHIFPPDLYEFPADAIRADWISALSDPDGETYLAFEADQAVGVVSLRHGVLRTLYVMPAFWSRGIGSTLHDLALVRLRETNVEEARLWTLTENHRARAFYEKRGWRLTGRTRVVPYPPHPIDVEYTRSTLRDREIEADLARRFLRLDETLEPRRRPRGTIAPASPRSARPTTATPSASA